MRLQPITIMRSKSARKGTTNIKLKKGKEVCLIRKCRPGFEKLYFTLLELLIVILIISFGAILTSVKMVGVLQEQRFLSESQQVLHHLSMAQDLMLILDTDVLVRIAKDREHHQINVWLEVEKPFDNEAWGRFIERKLALGAIQSFEFEGVHEEDLTLKFSLGVMSHGTLILFEGKKDETKLQNKKKYKIELPGYPCPIITQSLETKEQDKVKKSELLYPIEIYEKLYSQNPKNST
jgi:hypothetical protein